MPKGQVELKDFTAYWEEKTPVLKNINLSIKSGECVCLVGQVGSGKSSLLNCLLGEVPLYKGRINFNGKLAFVEQEPYVFSQSVKDNILFGSPFNQALYNNVVKACCLEQDIAAFDLQDETIIGERGINISGGQKARISLARAMYSQADIYLLDDPLSAVDSKVAKRLFFDVVKVLSENSTVILATHQIHFTKHSDRIYIFEQGEITQSGIYEDLKEHLNQLSSELHKVNETSSFQSQQRDIDNFDQDNNNNMNDQINNDGDNLSKSEQRNEQEQKEEIENEQILKEEETKEKQKEQNQDERQIFKKEEDVKVRISTYLKYLGLSKVSYIIPFVVGLYVTNEIVYIYFNRQLGDYDDEADKQKLINTLGYLVLIYLINYFFKYFLMCLSISTCGQKLHHKMIHALFRAKILFFDQTPSGQILNKFSTDIGTIDQDLSNIIMQVFDIFMKLIVLFITIMTITPYFIIVAGCELVVFIFFIKFSKQGLLQIKQLDLKNRSPVFTFFNLTIQGVLPIRTYKQENNFEKQFNVLASNSLRASLYYWLSQRGFGGWIHLFATTCNSIGIFLIISITTSSSQIGQSLTYFMVTTIFLQWGIRQLIQLDVSMTSVQRCLTIVETQQEAPLRTPYDQQSFKKSTQAEEKKISHNKIRKNKEQSDLYRFPEKGQLEFKNVKMRYRENLNLVLNGLSFKINQGERVGFVGRTGAGKSSLIQALFRMTEIEQCAQPGAINLEIDDEQNRITNINDNKDDGSIVIDGHDIKNIGLHTLRSGISIIPQVPFIFSGTIRRNLDPLNQYTDQQIIDVLHDIGLYEKVYQFKENILTDMINANQIFSSGQKQLICLGRAILRQSQLIVLDEATANCDMLTDELIQQKIRERFSKSTIITIAHRLNTIADYDKVIVIDSGQVAEYGSPYSLLLNQNGLFYQMVQHTGKNNAQLIFSIASKNQENLS